MHRLLVAGVMTIGFLSFGAAAAQDTITLSSLLQEMTDREAIARFPDPAYTCKQFSSYDRRSTTPDDPKTWFANGDCSQYLRVEEVGGPAVPAGSSPKPHKEWVMADMDGPGAIVRIWSANPAGTMRIYLDGATIPVIEAPMADILGSKWKVAAPLSQECSKGWNLYLPIPYAKHCKITSDKDGFYYQVNYRTYTAGTSISSLSMSGLESASAKIDEVQKSLDAPRVTAADDFDKPLFLKSGEKSTFSVKGPAAITQLAFGIQAEHYKDPAAGEQALRSLIVSMTFDGEQTVWCPLGDFLGSGVGLNKFADHYRRVGDGNGSFWVMPFEKTAEFTFTNVGQDGIAFDVQERHEPWSWDARSMHFHANWHYQYPIHAYGGRGTEDWNYIEASGKGVYVGDTLAVMNPVTAWWGEGDEKIYVDGEKFPSHFGTGTEDYYGYAWCWPVAFQHPFHAQPRVDGNGKNNWGHTTVTRVRSLDAIPFTKSLKFDMEIWHWKECDEAYAATTYWYALPGATCNRPPQPEDAAKPVPQPPPLPPPFTVPGAVEFESLTVLSQTPGLEVEPQDMDTFGEGRWSGHSHMWVKGQKIGDFVEFKIPTKNKGPQKVTLYATKSWDYAIVQFKVNGKDAGKERDLFSGLPGKVEPSGPIELGTFEPIDGSLTLRAQIVGSNPAASPPKTYFGLDCILVTNAE